MSIPPTFPRRFSKYLLLSVAYFIGAWALLMLYQSITHTQYLRGEDCFLNWDAGHYYYLAHNPYQGYRVAFFPLFPFIWKILGLRTYGIVLFNGLLFIIAASLLARIFQFSIKEHLVMLTFPTLVFMFLPYSESVFFFSSTLALAGIKNNNNWLVFTGMLLASVARPVVYIFAPALLIMFYLVPNPISLPKKIFFYFLPVLLGLAIVMTIDYFTNGSLFAFFAAQKLWGNYYQLPKLPLHTWGGDTVMKLDATAMLTGMIATVVLGRILLKKTSKKAPQLDAALVFSLLYLAAICWIVLFTRGGSMFSLNRFVFATPFFYIALLALFKNNFNIKQYLLIFFCINAFWLIAGSYVHIQVVLQYLVLSLFLICYALINHEKKYISVPAIVICIAANVFMQIYFYNYFLDTCWVA